MNGDTDLAPIIVKKKKGHGGHHGGAWKVAYADFVTAMMALFIVLWVLSQDDAMKESVARYFKDPIGFSDKGKGVMVAKTSSVSDAPSSAIEDKQLLKKSETTELKKMGEKIISELSSNPKFKKLSDQIEIQVTDEGLRIEIMDSDEDLFFEVGTSTLKSNAQLLLKEIGDNLASVPNLVVVEGHTDSRPFSGNGKGMTNFELSSDRANAARRALTQSALDPSKIYEVRGYADRRLRDKVDPYNVVNRRISIIVKYSGENLENE